MRKSYAVIGLGKFGYHIAKGLIDNGENVILCDNNEQILSEFHDVEQLYVLDSKDKIALKEAGVSELDVVIVSIGEDIESSILTVMALKELNNAKIIAKAVSIIHGSILEKLGVDEVIYPERQAAKRLLSEIIKASVEEVDLSANMKACKTIVLGYFAKRSIEEITNEDHIKVVAIKRDETWNLQIENDFILQKGDVILYIGNNADVDLITQKIENP